jgi:hypothetical protein
MLPQFFVVVESIDVPYSWWKVGKVVDVDNVVIF